MRVDGTLHIRNTKGEEIYLCRVFEGDHFEVLFQKRVRGFHQISKHEKTFETRRPQAEWFYCFRVFENLMKPEARVFEITSPTKKLDAVIILMSFLRDSVANVLVCEIIFAFNATFFSLAVFQFEANTSLHKPNAAEMTENRFTPAKTFEEEEKCVASAISKSTGNIKTNGRLEFWNNVCGIRRLVEEKNANFLFSSMHRT